MNLIPPKEFSSRLGIDICKLNACERHTTPSYPPPLAFFQYILSKKGRSPIDNYRYASKHRCSAPNASLAMNLHKNGQSLIHVTFKKSSFVKTSPSRSPQKFSLASSPNPRSLPLKRSSSRQRLPPLSPPSLHRTLHTVSLSPHRTPRGPDLRPTRLQCRQRCSSCAAT